MSDYVPDDADLFPFGAHKDVPYGKVPATYLDWLADQKWIETWPTVKNYINKNRSAIDKELKDRGLID